MSASAMASISNFPTSTTAREKQTDIYKQLPAIFNDFSKILATSIAAKSLFITNQNVMICLVIMIVVYLLVLVPGTLLQLYITSYIMLVLVRAASILALILIEPTVAFNIALLWVAVFILVAIFHRHELCEFMSSVIGKVKSLIWSENLESPRPEV